MKLGLLHHFLRPSKKKTISDTSDSFLGQKWPIFAPKTAFLAHFEIIDGISLFFQYPIWMKLNILHQFLRLMKIKKVLDTSDSFWGQKSPIFAPQNSIFC